MRYQSTALREERASLYEAMKAIIDGADKREGDEQGFTAEERAELTKLETRFDEATSELATIEKLEGYSPEQRAAERNRPIEVEERELPTGEKAEYLAAMQSYVRSGDPSDLAEFRADMKVGTAANGGYAVPQTWATGIIDTLKDVGVMYSLSTVITTSSGAVINYPVVASDASVGLRAELAAFAQGEPTLGTVALGAYDIGALEKVSWELLQDSAYDIGKFLADHTALKLAQKEDQYFIAGTGASQPKGVVVGAPTVAAGGAAVISVDDFINLYYAVGAPYRKNGVFIVADATAAAARKLKDSTGNYLWQPAVALGQPDTLLGRPFYTDPSIPGVATAQRSAVFGDMARGYVIRQVGTPDLQVLNELFAVNGEVGFILHHRVDGNVVDTGAVRALLHP